MNNKNKISVIVPVYNLQKYIKRCIGSILKQTYTNIEIIVVDDGSTDNSRKIIKEMAEADARIVMIFKENGGAASARLAGIEKASGDWIGFVDGDDEIELDMYELLLKNAVKYQADISHCGYQMIFKDGRSRLFYGTECIEISDKITGIRDLLDGSKIEPGLWNKIYHESLFHDILKNKVIDINIKINEDLLMNYYLFNKAEKSIFYDVCKYHYLIHNESVSQQKLDKKKIFDPIRVKEIILSDCPKVLKEDAKGALLRTCIYSYSSLITEGRGFEDEKKKVRNLIIKYYKYRKWLSKRTKVLAVLIVKLPYIYCLLYVLYSKYIQKKKYK